MNRHGPLRRAPNAMTTEKLPPRHSRSVMAAQEQWESVLSRDRERMTHYERVEVDQDLQGTNLLAAVEPSATINMGMRNLRQELSRLRRQHLGESRTESGSAEQPQPARPLVDTKSPRPLTREQRILSSSYIVENDETLLRFIRADRLDAQKAAQRILNYYSLAMEHFGDEILHRPLSLDDLDRRERKILESGLVQLLLTRDTTGRRIITLDQVGSVDPAISVHTLKVLMYVFQVAALDEDTQKQGVHLIIHRLFNTESTTGTVDQDTWMIDAQEREMLQSFFASTSVRCSIIHISTPSLEKWASLVPSLIQLFGPDERARIQFHHECSNKMAEYGVPIEWMPMTSTGRRKLNDHKVWIKLQHEREAALQRGQPLNVVECPRPNDILLTKTRRASSHPGNQKLRHILQERYEERYSAHPMKKQLITNQVADDLEEKLSCRFLVKNKESLWVLAERSTVLDKLGNCFRFVPRLKPKPDERKPVAVGSDRKSLRVSSAVDEAMSFAAGYQLKAPSPPGRDTKMKAAPPSAERGQDKRKKSHPS